jgi:hypothetical protein
MSDEKTWKDGRLGSFLLGRRYRDRKLEAEVGRLYEAHHLDTGTSALVLP